MENVNSGGEICERCLLRCLSSQEHCNLNLKDLIKQANKNKIKLDLENKSEQTAMNIGSKVWFHIF